MHNNRYNLPHYYRREPPGNTFAAAARLTAGALGILAPVAYQQMYTPKRKRLDMSLPRLGKKGRRQSLFSRRRVIMPRRSRARVFRSRKFARSFPRRRFKRYSRRSSRRSGMWSRPDIYRTVNGVFQIGTAVNETAAALVTQQWSCSSIYVNPLFTAEGLGNHGFFDIVGLDTNSGTGAFNLQTSAAFRLRCQSIRRPLKWRHTKQTLSVHFTPDWQNQAVPDATDATPVFGSSTKMVLRPFMLVTKRRMPYADVLSSVADSTSLTGVVVEDETSTTAVSSITNDGWFQKITRGIVKRYGPTSYATSATPRVITAVRSSVADPFSRTTLPFNTPCKDGVKLEDSIDLYRDFYIRRLKPVVITPGDSATRTYRMPDCTYTSDSLGVNLPININETGVAADNPKLVSNVVWFPKGYAIFGVFGQVQSNVVDKSTRVPVKFNAQYTYSTGVIVADSALGGNLFVDNVSASTNMLPANPARIISTTLVNNEP